MKAYMLLLVSVLKHQEALEAGPDDGTANGRNGVGWDDGHNDKVALR